MLQICNNCNFVVNSLQVCNKIIPLQTCNGQIRCNFISKDGAKVSRHVLQHKLIRYKFPLQVRCKLVAIQLQFTYQTFISILLQIRYCFAIDLSVAKFSLQIRIFLVELLSSSSFFFLSYILFVLLCIVSWLIIMINL